MFCQILCKTPPTAGRHITQCLSLLIIYCFLLGYHCQHLALRASKQPTMIQKTIYKTKDYCKVKFNLDIQDTESVSILGLNGDWHNPVPMKKKKDGSFTAELQLPKSSQHEFRYLLNESEWINEPEADGEVENSFGSSNSVLSL